jgi:hypothetical protein
MGKLLESALVFGMYPLWLLAGAGDYLCHRRTGIEHTSGTGESWYHLLQFVCLAVALAIAVLVQPNIMAFSLMIAAVLAHSVLAFLDVTYTYGKRIISPLEQTIHGYMEVLPWVAVALFGILHWPQIVTDAASLTWVPREQIDARRFALIGSFVVLAGAPVLEEYLRTRALARSSRLGNHQIKNRDERHERDDAECHPPIQKAPIARR